MIPNILTTARLILVPIFAYLILGAENLQGAAIVFVVSGLTDIVDGYIARHFNMITNFGKIYDPFVDKLMQITAIVCLALADIVPVWIIGFVVIKEVTMIVIGGILYLKKIVVYSNWYGKMSTVIFYAIVFTMIIAKDSLSGGLMTTLLVIMVVAMVSSALVYLIDTIKHLDEKRI